MSDLSNDSRVELLEDLVQSKLEHALGGVAKERRRPSLTKLTHTRLSKGHLEALDDPTVPRTVPGIHKKLLAYRGKNLVSTIHLIVFPLHSFTLMLALTTQLA